MRRQFLVAAALLLIAASAAAEPAREADFSGDRFRAHVAFLSDDLLEGRDSGSRGYDIAAAYVASQFEALGLKPGGEGGGWYQPVPLRSSVLAQPPASVTIIGPKVSKSWPTGTDVLIGPSAFQLKQDLTASVVFVGYGMEAPDQKLDDYRGLDVRGKIVAVLSGAPADVPSELGAYLADQKAAVAARHGAVGIVTVDTKVSAEAFPWEIRVRRSGRARMDWLERTGVPFDESPGLHAGASLNAPAADALFAGAARSYAEVRAEAERPNARPRGFPLRTKVRIKRTSRWTEVAGREVIGILPGSDPKLAAEYVVLMGHLDHLGVKADAKPGEDRIYNGALDNAAGIATMLEAARAFVQAGERPRRSIMFIANTAEEKGLLGSDYFAHYPTVPIGSIAAVVDLDMPLLLYDFTDVVAFGAEHSTMGEAVARAAREMNVALSPDPMPEQNIFVRSDHYSFVKKGVPAVLLATGFANGGEAQWRGFLSGAYHNVNDDMRQPIHWQAGARYARLNYLISRELADADQQPRWYQGDFFGDLYAPNQPRAPRPAR